MPELALDPEFAPPPDAKPSDPTGRALAWLRAHEPGVIVAGVVLQVLILALTAASSVLPTFGAPTVLLRVVPVDPRDLMRGDYVTLGYEIGRDVPPSFQPGETVYVELLPEDDGRHYRGGATLRDRPTSGRFIRGTVDGSRRIVFGIESYYVREGKGKEYERAILNRRLSARVALAADGQAALRALVYDGEP